MSETEKIVTLENLIQSKLLEEILTEKNIPFIIRSYHDSAYDGLWQMQSGWGHVEAPPEYKEEILKVFEIISKPAPE
ncbi:MAG: hypothetical protein DRI73_08200 [Bacteroidetes bacterium]|nr:MAG: hypothetical protein DRI73_08200 [Bacteroidota bacterium]